MKKSDSLKMFGARIPVSISRKIDTYSRDTGISKQHIMYDALALYFLEKLKQSVK